MNPDGVTPGVIECEEVCVGICLMLTADNLRSTGLTGDDFYMTKCGEIWDAALSLSEPCPSLMLLHYPDLHEVWERAWARRDMSEFTPEVLIANAAEVRRDSERRRRLRELGKEAQRVHRGEVAFYERPENQREMDV